MKGIILLLFLMIFIVSVQAQITISPDDVLNLIGTRHYIAFDTDEEATATVDIGLAGANRVWDFTSLVFPSQEVSFDYIDPAETPLAYIFPEANIAQKMTFTEDTVSASIYEYLKVNNDSLIFLGAGTYIEGYGVFDIETKDEYAPMPLAYETTWSFILEDTIYFPGGYIYDFDDIQITIDAWGTITIPAGTFECLRLHSRWTNIKHQVIDNVIVDRDTSIGASVSWISKNSMELVNFNFEFPNGTPQYTEAQEVSISQEIITSLEEQDAVRNLTYLLEQNFPNPFNPRTTIHFSLPANDHALIEVFTIHGQKVQTLLNSALPAGHHSIDFDAAHLSSGVYIYRMSAGRYNDVKKMVVLK
jgi:hypothetical protein